MAIILLATKSLGLLMRKLGLPQVLGYILAGILIGGAIWELIPGTNFTNTLLPPILSKPYEWGKYFIKEISIPIPLFPFLRSRIPV